jgi:phage I-like protein
LLRVVSKGLPQNVLRLGFALQLDASAAEAKWQKVFPLGETRHRSDFGTITFSREWLAQMLTNYQAEGKPERQWDYFHRGSSGDTEVRNEDKVASGWFSDMKLEADGLYVLTTWTDAARAKISAKELRYPSPTFVENALDPKTGKPCGPKLLAVALLNDPFLTDLPPVQAAENPPPPKGTSMKLAATVAAALSLSETATESDLEAAVKAKLAELDAAKSEVVKLKAAVDAKDSDATKLAERVKSLEQAQKNSVEAQLKADTVALCTKLEGEGRITAAEKADVEEDVKAFGIEKASARWSKRPVIVDMKERGTNRPGPDKGMDPVEAKKQLELKAEEIRTKRPDDAPRAFLLASQENPDLAIAAAKLTAMKPEELDRVIPLR